MEAIHPHLICVGILYYGYYFLIIGFASVSYLLVKNSTNDNRWWAVTFAEMLLTGGLWTFASSFFTSHVLVSLTFYMTVIAVFSSIVTDPEIEVPRRWLLKQGVKTLVFIGLLVWLRTFLLNHWGQVELSIVSSICP